MQATWVDFRFGHSKWACGVPILFLSFGCVVAAAQCSQATRPQPASPAPSTVSAANVPPASAGGESSSSEITKPIAFKTGAAITVLEETPLQVITDVPISSRTSKPGGKLPLTVTRDVIVDGILVVPCGARVYGVVVSAKQAGRLVGSSNLTLQLTELDLGGRTYPLYTPPFKVVGQSKTRPTAAKVATGAAVGAIAADVTAPKVTYTIEDPTGAGRTVTENLSAAQRARGVAAIAGMGAGVGLAIAASGPPSIAAIPAESQLEFILASPIAVYPVDQSTAMRLSQGMHHGNPILYIRGESQ